MKVTVPRSALLAAAAATAPAVAPRGHKPVLACLKLTALDDLLTVQATDLEVGIRFDLRGVAVARPGSALVPADRLAAVVREAGDADVTLDADDRATVLDLAGGRYELPAGDPAEFPEVPGFGDGDGPVFEVAAGVLRTLVRRVQFAAEKRESTRWAMTGVLFEPGAGTLTLVATDTKRLAVAVGPAAGAEPAGRASHLVPLKAVRLLVAALGDDGEPVRVALRPTAALFRTERAVLHTQLVEGRFPPWRDILPKAKAGNARFAFPAPALAGHVRRAALLNPSDLDTRRVTAALAPGRLRLTSQSPDHGAADVPVALPDFAGPAVTFAFDPRYLADALGAAGESVVGVEVSDRGDRTVLRVDGWDCLIMNMVD